MSDTISLKDIEAAFERFWSRPLELKMSRIVVHPDTYREMTNHGKCRGFPLCDKCLVAVANSRDAVAVY